MLLAITPFNPAVNTALTVCAVIVIILSVIFAAIILGKTQKMGKTTRQVSSAPGKTQEIPQKTEQVTSPPMTQSARTASEVNSPVAPTEKSAAPLQATPTTVPANTFQIGNLEVIPRETQKGETVAVLFRVTNTSPFSSYYHAELIVNDKLVRTKGVGLAPWASKWITFNIVENTAGEHTVKIGDLESKFIVS